MTPQPGLRIPDRPLRPSGERRGALREANDAIEGFYRDAEPLKPGAAPQGMLAFEAAARS